MAITACTISASEPLGTSSDAALECNASTLDELVNGSTTVTSRTGKQLKSIAQLEQDYFVVAVNNGIWALGQIFTAYNQFMVFGGTAYRPKASTTLPYPIEATPNLTFVEPVTTVNLRADQVTYDNASSGLAATDAQEAIDEIDSQVDTNTGNIATNTSDIGTNTTDIGTNTTDISTNADAIFPDSISTGTPLVVGKNYLSTATATHTVPTGVDVGDEIGITWLDGTVMTLTSAFNISVTKDVKITDTTWVFTNFIADLTLVWNGTEWEIK